MPDSSDDLFGATDSFWEEVASCADRVLKRALDEVLAENDLIREIADETLWDSVEETADRLISRVVEAVIAPEEPPHGALVAPEVSMTSWDAVLHDFIRGLALPQGLDCVVDSSGPAGRSDSCVSDASSVWCQFASALSCERGTLQDLLLQASLQERRVAETEPLTGVRDTGGGPPVDTADVRHLEDAGRASRRRGVINAAIRSEHLPLSKEYLRWRRWGFKRALWYLGARLHVPWRGPALERLMSEVEAAQQLAGSFCLELSNWTIPSLSLYFESHRDSVRITRIRIFNSSRMIPSRSDTASFCDRQRLLVTGVASEAVVLGRALRLQPRRESTPEEERDSRDRLFASTNAWTYLVIVDGTRGLAGASELELAGRPLAQPTEELIGGVPFSLATTDHADREARRPVRHLRLTIDGSIVAEEPAAQAGPAVLPSNLETDRSSDSSYRLCKGASHYVSSDEVEWWKWERPPENREFEDRDVADARDPANA